MRDYVFMAGNGYNLISLKKLEELDLEKLKIIGFSKGKDPKEAFKRLIDGNKHIKNVSLRGLCCFEMMEDSWKRRNYL